MQRGEHYEVRAYTDNGYALVITRLGDKAKAVFLGEDALQLDMDFEAAEAADVRGELPLDVTPCDFVCGTYDNMLRVTH